MTPQQAFLDALLPFFSARLTVTICCFLYFKSMDLNFMEGVAFSQLWATSSLWCLSDWMPLMSSIRSHAWTCVLVISLCPALKPDNPISWRPAKCPGCCSAMCLYLRQTNSTYSQTSKSTDRQISLARPWTLWYLSPCSAPAASKTSSCCVGVSNR